MARTSVQIDSGPISATDRLRDVPENKWRLLMDARKHFLEVRLSHDCRCLVEFVEDAKAMYKALGFKSPEAMIREGYGLKPEEIEIAVRWIELNPSDEDLPLKDVVKLAKRGAPIGSKNAASNKDSTYKPCSTRFNYGTAAHWLARLDRDGHKELAAHVRSGKLSANAAAIEAGFRKKLTSFEQVCKLIPKLTSEEREKVREMLG